MIPADFYQTLVEHYTSRLAQVISAGRQYTTEYFFVRNSLSYHKSMIV
jgi:hypothetical protein